MSRRYKGRSRPPARPAAFRTFGEIRPLMDRFVLPIYDDPDGPAFEILFHSEAAALAHKARLIEADRIDFERL